ncbi:MAG: hypothetical protein H6713_15555 [Myxococcales bacterium]|nr:hypothetical protein [Myxococcales bacterium]
MDNEPLRWVVSRRGVRGCPDCDRLHVIVSAEDRKGSFVLVHAPNSAGPDVAIGPRQIAALVRLARADGWTPGAGPRDEIYRLSSAALVRIVSVLWPDDV